MIESCEYSETFLNLAPTLGVVLNIAFYMYLNRAEQRKRRTAA